jgi:hypothetical protein
MSTLKGILANKALMTQTQRSVWFPTIQEGLALHDAQLLPSGELMDFGLAFFTAEGPDKEIAVSLATIATEKKYELPILASFNAFGLKLGGQRYGVMPTFVSEDELVTGEDAKNTLKRFSYVEDSGVRRLFRGTDGGWYAGWGYVLDDFGGYCGVGRIS